jgi:hypothetical protein
MRSDITCQSSASSGSLFLAAQLSM